MSQRHWETAEELYADWTAYKNEMNSSTVEFATKSGAATRLAPKPITIIGFCARARISVQKFYAYKNREAFAQIMEIIENEHEAFINEGAATGEFSSTWFKVYGPNKFGYTDRSVSLSLPGSMSEADKQLLSKMAGVLGIGEGAIEGTGCESTERTEHERD